MIWASPWLTIVIALVLLAVPPLVRPTEATVPAVGARRMAASRLR